MSRDLRPSHSKEYLGSQKSYKGNIWIQYAEGQQVFWKRKCSSCGASNSYWFELLKVHLIWLNYKWPLRVTVCWQRFEACSGTCLQSYKQGQGADKDQLQERFSSNKKNLGDHWCMMGVATTKASIYRWLLPRTKIRILSIFKFLFPYQVYFVYFVNI